MTIDTNLLIKVDNSHDDESARSFCYDFIHSSKPKFIFGTNEYATSIANYINVEGFIDEFTPDKEFMGKPIIQLDHLPKDCLVVSAVVLAFPWTALRKLISLNISHLDYFGFKKYSGLNLIPVVYHHDNFESDFKTNQLLYNKLYSLLVDDESRTVMTKIINFRLSNDINYMREFVDKIDRQYFEDFLDLKPKGEIFADVGCFDGYTSHEFIKRCPNYNAVHIFEPEPKNMAIVQEHLGKYPRIIYHDYGLSNQIQSLKFKSQGSASTISVDGDIEINVKRLDDILDTPITFLKMDIEGGEGLALEGAKQTIKKYHPKMAISVYHRFDDFWRISQQILSIRKDYQIYLRHYTEGVTETVMFFIPNKSGSLITK